MERSHPLPSAGPLTRAFDAAHERYKLSNNDFMEFSLPFSPRILSGRTAVAMGVLFVACVASGQLVHYLFPAAIAPALIWPPFGIALAGMVLEGYAVWPAIFLASLANSIFYGTTSVTLMVVMAVANVVQAMVGAWLLRTFNFQLLLARLHDVILLMAISALTTLIVPIARVVTLVAERAVLPGSGAISMLGDWWTGGILSVLILVPLLIRWIAYPKFSRKTRDWVEIGLAFFSLIAIDLLLFATRISQARGVPLVYLLLVPLIWIALRIGPRMMSLALFLNASIAIVGTALGYGNAAALPLSESIFQAEIFSIMMSVIFLMLCAIAEDRKNYANDLARHVGRLEDAVLQIKKEDEAKSRFIATLAHELRNPLAPLLSSLELLNADPQKSDDTRLAAADMTVHVRTMRHLLDDLLDISRISRGKLTLQREHVELHSIVDQSARVVSGIMRERGHELVISLPDTAILLEADPVRLEQIIVNLLNNAAKYTPDGGRIVLSAETAGRVVRISVKDNGIGIDPALQHRIFEPFLQLEENIQKLSGLGIGLSLTKNLVDMHGGTIDVKSEGAGKGSEFVVTLPLQNLAVAETESAPKPAQSRIFRILIVDDNRAAANALGKLLDRAGHVVKTAYSGLEGLEAADSFDPDVILLDIGMPEMDGHETARRLRSNETRAVLIALTGYGQDSDRRQAQDAGFHHHLTKPVGLAELEEVFAEIPPIV